MGGGEREGGWEREGGREGERRDGVSKGEQGGRRGRESIAEHFTLFCISLETW